MQYPHHFMFSPPNQKVAHRQAKFPHQNHQNVLGAARRNLFGGSINDERKPPSIKEERRQKLAEHRAQNDSVTR